MTNDEKYEMYYRRLLCLMLEMGKRRFRLNHIDGDEFLDKQILTFADGCGNAFVIDANIIFESSTEAYDGWLKRMCDRMDKKKGCA